MENNPKKKIQVKQNTQTAKSTKQKKKRGFRSFMNGIIIIFLSLVLIGSVTAFVLLARIVASTDTSELVNSTESTIPSQILDKNDKKATEVGGESRELITYEQLPQSVIDAFLSIEDSRYFAHNGFDLPRFISSAFTNLQSGEFAQGGSTLTMQTVDNSLIKPKEEADALKGIEPTKIQQIESKIKEIYLSMKLETDLSKEDILVRYLNKINFGSYARGIQKGAQYYFGKNVEDLNLSESAFLAGVINAPNSYNPYGKNLVTGESNYENAVERRNSTLYQMRNHGYISETEYKLAKSTKLAFQLKGATKMEADEYSSYAKLVAEEALSVYGIDIYTTPVKIYTALDTEAQKISNSIIDGEIIALPNGKNDEYLQFGFTALDNQTGEIRAIGDGRQSGEIYLRRSADPHQPGSSIKPILAYPLTFDKLGWATSRVVEDKELVINGITINNFDLKHYGKVPLSTALARSLNTTAIRAMDDVIQSQGTDYMKKYMTDMGFSEKVAEGFNHQYAIGGSTMEASSTQMAGAFASLANGGNYIEPHTIRKIEFLDGSKTIENNVEKNNVLSPQAAFMMSETLNKAVTGENAGLNYIGLLGSFNYPVYGKTGTTSWDDADVNAIGGAMRDSWTMLYNSEYVISVWSGFDRRIDGVSYYNKYIDQNYTGKIAKYLLDSMSKNPVRIPNPGGVSQWSGGLIKTEFLSQARKLNPLTGESDVKTNNLSSAVKNAGNIDTSKYTADSISKLQAAISAANLVLANKDATQEEVDSALAAINAAKAALEAKPEEKPTTSTTGLSIALADALSVDPTRYTPDSYAKLQAAITTANQVLGNDKATQGEINAQIAALAAAKAGLVIVTNPVTPTP